jgi:UPF0716 protein FxsA
MSTPYRGVLFLIFIAVPFLELALLIKAGQYFGFWPTLGIVLATAVAGATLLHRQGLAAIRRIFSDIEGGAIPVESVADGAMIMIAGALLLAPGFLTDTAGLLLLINRLLGADRTPASPAGTKKPGRTTGPVVIETEFERLDERTVEPNRERYN